MRNSYPLFLAFAGFSIFVSIWANRDSNIPSADIKTVDRVVFSAPVLLLMAAGDRFLAADIEAVRVVATGNPELSDKKNSAESNIRSHQIVAQLNACHEDNYYIGNALLSWGGASKEGSDLLRRAMDCRTWDELPAFFYGFNQFFFHRNLAEAQWALEIAARRSIDNSAAFRKLAIMIAAENLRDDQLALEYLGRERAVTTDPKLRQMLDRRIARLNGLIALRDAQRRYEARTGRKLTDPELLISDGELNVFPSDPMNIGYEFHDGAFRLKERRIAGMENPR